MTALEVFSALQGINARVVRGGEQGLPPPTLGYTLAADKEGHSCALLIRAYLKEQCDALAIDALNRLQGLGFYLDSQAEGSERDTGVFTLKVALRRGHGPLVQAGGEVVGGVRTCRLQRRRPPPLVALDGAARPQAEEVELVLTLESLPQDPGQRNLKTQGVRLDIGGEAFRGYQVLEEGDGRRSTCRHVLLPFTE